MKNTFFLNVDTVSFFEDSFQTCDDRLIRVIDCISNSTKLTWDNVNYTKEYLDALSNYIQEGLPYSKILKVDINEKRTRTETKATTG